MKRCRCPGLGVLADAGASPEHLALCCPECLLASTEAELEPPEPVLPGLGAGSHLTPATTDLRLLLPLQVERQGLDASASVAAVEGVPVAAVERWEEQTGTQRLLENLAAYRTFRALLAQMLEEQREQLGEADAGLGRALAAVLLQVSAFAYHLEELLRLESHGPPSEDRAGVPPTPNLGLFEKKLRGLGVLRELAQWAVRSMRDLRQLAKPSPDSSTAPSPSESP